MHSTLIRVDQLQALQRAGTPLRVFDCSFDLMQPDSGLAQYRQAHIPGALHADLDRHLSTHAPGRSVNGGRHPLPLREDVAQWLGQCGVDADTQVVVYDRQGLNYCGRLWWMLQWCGHAAVAVLDGGWQAWQAAGGAVADGDEALPEPRVFALRPPQVVLRHTHEVHASLDGSQTLIDARGAPRYRGEVEPLDPVAGHIPGALNRPFNSNLDERGFFKTPEVLRAEFATLLGSRDPAQVVHHCGSGVSAVPNVLAMEVAGLGRTALYAGSWSEWCNTPGLPVAKG